ncbi:MAG: GNAT family N-acetyltransferase [Frankiaceae bacterium]|nr:GNAT family N-acetyltransferase [Frankiaceae bacterium]
MADPVVVRDGDASDVGRMTWAATEHLRAAWREQAVRAGAGEVCFLVAVVDGHVVGKAVVDWTHNADGSAWLWMFSVHPDFRRRGIGRHVLAEAEDRARLHGCPAIEMAVDDDNPRARDLYVREGYTVAGTHMDEYEYTETSGATVRVASPGALLRKAL